MRILYVAPRFHSNQIPIIRGWQQEGSEVLFVSQFSPAEEDHSILEPIVLGYSSLFEFFMRILRFLIWRNDKSDKREYDLRIKVGFPPKGSASRIIQDFLPDVVIVRERAFYNVPFVRFSKRLGIPCVLYNQTALGMENRSSFRMRLTRSLFPKARMTPVRSVFENDADCKTDYFVPFIQEIVIPFEEKRFFQSDRVDFLCVARYEARKNLLLLVNAYAGMQGMERTHLTIVGEKLSRDQIEYYERLQEEIDRLGIQNSVTLKENCSREQVYQEYARADLFVLPSTRERASVSQLEAMSCSLPVICSDTNGTACYVEHGQNGFLFHDNDVNDLRDRMERLSLDRDMIKSFGRRSYELVLDRYQFKNYRDCIERIREDLSESNA